MGKRKIPDVVSRSREVLKKQRVQLAKKQSAGSSFLDRVFGFLKADSFMYGPLAAAAAATADEAPASRPGLEANGETNSGSSSPGSSSPVEALSDLLPSADEILKAAQEPIQRAVNHLQEASESSRRAVQGTFASVHKTVTTTTTEAIDNTEDLFSKVLDVLRHDTGMPKSADAGQDTEPEGDADEGHSSHERDDDLLDHIPLDRAVAEKVSNQLIAGLGGRFSDDLNINVDKTDDEVESWFVAAHFFCRSVPLDVSKRTYKELSEAGVAKMSDLLNLEDSRLASMLEATGFTKYGHRVALQLHKLATHLEENYWGRISTFKHTTDSQQLIRDLRSIPGVTLFATRTFLRELRGVWAGALPEFDMKTKRAAKHLKLLGSIKAASSPETLLSDFAHSSGIDIRDLEVALFKLGTEHEQHYGECPGGADCAALEKEEKLLATLPSDVLL